MSHRGARNRNGNVGYFRVFFSTFFFFFFTFLLLTVRYWLLIVDEIRLTGVSLPTFVLGRTRTLFTFRRWFIVRSNIVWVGLGCTSYTYILVPVYHNGPITPAVCNIITITACIDDIITKRSFLFYQNNATRVWSHRASCLAHRNAIVIFSNTLSHVLQIIVEKKKKEKKMFSSCRTHCSAPRFWFPAFLCGEVCTMRVAFYVSYLFYNFLRYNTVISRSILTITNRPKAIQATTEKKTNSFRKKKNEERNELLLFSNEREKRK